MSRSEIDGIAPTLRDCFRTSGKNFRSILRYPTRTKNTARFFIGKECKNNVARWFVTNLLPHPNTGKDHGIHILHINSAATPNTSILNHATKWIH